MKIFGDYHMHTYYSDGEASVLDMVRAAKDRDLKEIAITDHSFNKIFNGLRRKNFNRLVSDVESARSEMPILLGVESNVVSVDGHIDLDDKMRQKLDIVLFGVHVAIFYSLRGFFTFFLPNVFFNSLHFVPGFLKRRNTNIVKRVIEKNQIDIWTHPNRYFKLNVVEVARTCIEKGTALELSAKKISFRPIDFEHMVALGAKFVINTDAHSPKRVGDIARVEEFLKNCDYDPRCIINLNQTWTSFKTKKESDSDTQQNQTTDTSKKPKRWRRWF
ncbi:MAG: PHP domain-containing protein [Christensenellaceae bacterium]|jgi:putative hydrolase|nr:PHP domain-containing protein [Christensenellaceae bacterium]